MCDTSHATWDMDRARQQNVCAVPAATAVVCTDVQPRGVRMGAAALTFRARTGHALLGAIVGPHEALWRAAVVAYG